MFPVLLLVLLTQSQRDTSQYVMYQRLQADKAVYADIWHPAKQLQRDIDKADKCYVKFHLRKTDSCEAALSTLETDLKK